MKRFVILFASLALPLRLDAQELESGWLASAMAAASFTPGLLQYDYGLGIDMKGAEFRIERLTPSIMNLQAEVSYRVLGISCVEACPDRGVEVLVGPQFRFALPGPLWGYAGGAIGMNFGAGDLAAKAAAGMDVMPGPVGIRLEAGVGRWGLGLAAGVSVVVP